MWRKAAQKQSLTRTALKTHSLEVWREPGPERAFGLRPGQRSAEVFARMTAVIGDFEMPKMPRRMLLKEGLAERQDLPANRLRICSNNLA
jgi:hypothetical protein